MCELFGMSARFPATATLSMEELARHGGQTGQHRDGWGVAFFSGPDVHCVREPCPAAESPALRFMMSHAYRSRLVMAHIRLATAGERALRNTQPFLRELGGRMHVFAHNGDLPGIEARWKLHGTYCPVGETDSEYAFCVLLERMGGLWRCHGGVPPLSERLAVVAGFASELRELGPANFLYSDSDALFCHGDRRLHSGESVFRPPGLHLLERRCRTGGSRLRMAALSVASLAEHQRVALVASVPLSDEPWAPMEAGELLVLRDGVVELRWMPEQQEVSDECRG
ncbi:MAG TPA: class II glutamine amidotransferase [Chromatiales bacterium]|nr:class II glutamine amidotransferase [Chromatiales bacterium]